MKDKVILIQLGSPKAPTTKDVRIFLKEFLGDPRVVDLPPLLWKIILYLFILPFRPQMVVKLYRKIWNGSSFPLISLTKNFAHQVQLQAQDKLEIYCAFLVCPPRLTQIWELRKNKKTDFKQEKWLIVPQFPQYSEATTASVMDQIGHSLKNVVHIPQFELITDFHRMKAFIDHSVRFIERELSEAKKDGKNIDRLIFSFHGMPLRRITQKKDPYLQHCLETFYLLKRKIHFIDQDKISYTFQSRFGQEEWLQPYTEEFALNCVSKGEKTILFYCPSFVVDCLETLEEIGVGLKEKFLEKGGELLLVPCLNDDTLWAKDYAHWLITMIQGNAAEKQSLYYELNLEEEKMVESIINEKVEKDEINTPMSPQTKSSLKILFLTLFLDLLGFTIIFPMFPALAKYYLSVDSDNFFLRSIFSGINQWNVYQGGSSSFSPIVLFGGILGAMYSFLQFIFAPFWGSLSDRIGRKPILIFSLVGIAVGHLIWIFSGSFTLLLISRLMGGVMSGNISTATAVVADITTSKNRSKGMAIIGIAFALGFLVGPAIGGILSLWNLAEIFPALAAVGVNPFSVPAIFAFLLAVVNIFFLITQFKETLPIEIRDKNKNKKKESKENLASIPSTQRSANPLYLFRILPYKGVNLTNFGYFLFLTAFSGMEFTLTFLAVERFDYTSLDNAYMFIFIGVVIALVQGGLVRRKAAQVGEKKMAITGLICLIPGLVLIAFAQGPLILYFGLFFLSVGAAQAIPCLTTLVSLYTPSNVQGRVLGVFRSLGALARVIGPLLAAVIYSQWGSSYPYTLGALFLLIPILMLSRLPHPSPQP